MDEIYVKAFVAFIVGALVYNLIDSMKLCNKNIVEGQSTGDGTCSKVAGITGSQRADSVLEATCNAKTSKVDCEPTNAPDGSNVCFWTPSTASQNDGQKYGPLGTNSLNNIIDDIDKSLFSSDNDSDQLYFRTKISKLAAVTGTTKLAQTEITNASGVFANITSLSDLGNPFNSEALDLIELIIRNFIKSDSDTLKTQLASSFFQSEDLCANDINIYVYAFSLLLYNKSIDSSVEMGHIINISNRLSKYIPDILDKIQELYQNCENSQLYNKDKAQILTSLYHKLFKNNKTIINFNGISDLMKSLENVKTVYIVLFMICFTYIIVKFMGMFNMKVNM